MKHLINKIQKVKVNEEFEDDLDNGKSVNKKPKVFNQTYKKT